MSELGVRLRGLAERHFLFDAHSARQATQRPRDPAWWAGPGIVFSPPFSFFLFLFPVSFFSLFSFSSVLLFFFINHMNIFLTM